MIRPKRYTPALFFLAVILFVVFGCSKSEITGKESKEPVDSISEEVIGVKSQINVKHIWGWFRHSAFTDLLLFKDTFYCTFREGATHVSHDGRIRVLKSGDGENWENVASFEMAPRDSFQIDLRDPKLSLTPDNRIMVLMDVEYWVNREGTYIRKNFRPYISFSDNAGMNFSSPAIASMFNPNLSFTSYWIWRVSWNSKKEGYGFDYLNPLTLFKTADGKIYALVKNLTIDGSPNETTIRFDKNDNMYALIRRESGDKMGMLAVASPPYDEFTFNTLTERLGGPNFLFLNDYELVITTRLYNPGGKYSTGILVTDLQGKIKKKIALPSNGDCSYAGMVTKSGKLYVSYYSSHQNNISAIYFATVPLELLK